MGGWEVSRGSSAAETRGCRVQGSKDERNQPGTAAVNRDPICRSWHGRAGLTGVFLPSADRVPCGEREGEGTHWAAFLSGVWWSQKLPKTGKKWGALDSFANCLAAAAQPSVRHCQRRGSHGVRASLALLPLGFIACAAPRQQQPSGETVSKHFQKCVQGLAAEEATAGPSRKRHAHASAPPPPPGAAPGSVLPARGARSCSTHTPPRCSEPVPGYSTGSAGGAAVGRRQLPSSRVCCGRGKLALAILVPWPLLWGRGRTLSQVDLWPGPLHVCLPFTSLISHLWYETSSNFYISAGNAGQEQNWLLPDNSLRLFSGISYRFFGQSLHHSTFSAPFLVAAQ